MTSHYLVKLEMLILQIERNFRIYPVLLTVASKFARFESSW